MNIDRLIEESQKGDLESYRLIIRELAPSVKSFLLSRLNDYHAVEDISQEVFLAAYKSINTFEGNSQLKTWLISIARFKLMDHMRKSYAQNNLKATYQEEIQNLLVPEKENDNIKDTINKLQSCLEKLPEEAKGLIKCRYFNSETVMGLAQRLDSTENAISSKLFRLKKKLKNLCCFSGN